MYQLRSGSGGGAVADLLDALEAQAAALGVSHFAVSGPTLEEVFLAAAAADDAEDGAAGGAHAGDGVEPAAAEGERFTGRPASRSAHVANGAAARGAQGQTAGMRSGEGLLIANGKESGGQAAPAGRVGGGAAAAPAADGRGWGSDSAARANGAAELQAYQRDHIKKAALAPSAPALGPLSPPEPSVRHAESSGPLPGSPPEAHAEVSSASGAESERTAGAGSCADDMAEATAAVASDDSGAEGAAGKEAAAAEQASSAGVDRTSAAGVRSDGSGGTSGHDVAFGRSSEHGGELAPDGNPDLGGLKQGGSGNTVVAAPRAGDPELAGSGATAADAEWTAVSLDEPSRGDPATQQVAACAEGARGGGASSGAFGRVLRRRHRRRLRWWVAFREMVRKRAIIAGAPALSLKPAQMVCEQDTCADSAHASFAFLRHTSPKHNMRPSC